MEAKEFIELLKNEFGCNFFAGVPDSQLKELCYYLMHNENQNHMICANEGNAVGMAAGSYLSSGKIPVVYLQNSGIGNIINPVASLLDDKVYGIPCVFVVGWRGEPNVKDEPQHLFQGEITLSLFEQLGIKTIVIDPDTKLADLEETLKKEKGCFEKGKSLAIIVKKNTFSPIEKVKAQNEFTLLREAVIEKITQFTQNDVIVCTTGKASRELFEVRERAGQTHKFDFLTVGSMGHASSIAFGIAKNQPNKKVWCIDGDGAVIMHMGAMCILGANKPKNLVHILINNLAHETVGGMPTASPEVDYKLIAKGCGYPKQLVAKTDEELIKALNEAKEGNELTFIEICVGLGSRSDLGRPTTTPKQNKQMLMEHILGEDK